MRFGLMLPENESAQGLVTAQVAHPTEQLGDVVPVWARYRAAAGHFALDWQLLEELWEHTFEPVVYAETGTMSAIDIERGVHDDAFRLLAARARGALIRIFHEANGTSGLFAWQGWTPAMLIGAWQRVARLFHEEGARIAYCMSARNRKNDDLLDRWPGDESVDVVGFTAFKRRNDQADPPQQCAYTIERLAETGKEVWGFEMGVETTEEGTGAPITGRGKWMTAVGQVKGLAVALIFDRLIEFLLGGQPRSDDWRFNKAMRVAWDALPR